MPLYAYDVPCKYRFDLLETTLMHVRAGKDTKQLAAAIGQHLRHAFLLLQNASILGFIKKEGEFWVLTSSGISYLESEREEMAEILAGAVRNCRFISFLVEKTGSLEKAAELTIEQLTDILRNNTLVARNVRKPISRKTAERRANAVKRWMDWLECSNSETDQKITS